MHSNTRNKDDNEFSDPFHEGNYVQTINQFPEPDQLQRIQSIYNPLNTQIEFQNQHQNQAPYESEAEVVAPINYNQGSGDKYSMRIGSLFDSDDEESTFFNQKEKLPELKLQTADSLIVMENPSTKKSDDESPV